MRSYSHSVRAVFTALAIAALLENTTLHRKSFLFQMEFDDGNAIITTENTQNITEDIENQNKDEALGENITHTYEQSLGINNASYSKPKTSEWLFPDTKGTIVHMRGRKDRFGSRFREIFLMSSIAYCNKLNYCVDVKNSTFYNEQMSFFPKCCRDHSTDAIKYTLDMRGEDPVDGKDDNTTFYRSIDVMNRNGTFLYKNGDNRWYAEVLRSYKNHSCLFNSEFRRYWRQKILHANQGLFFKDSKIANEDLYKVENSSIAIIAVHVRRGDVTSKSPIFSWDPVVTQSIELLRGYVQKKGRIPRVHLFSENYGSVNWTTYQDIVDEWHLAPQMNEADTGHNMDLELNLRDWIHFLKADVLVTDGSFSNVVGALRDNVDLSNGFPLTFQYCKLGFKGHYHTHNCGSNPYNNNLRIAWRERLGKRFEVQLLNLINIR